MSHSVVLLLVLCQRHAIRECLKASASLCTIAAACAQQTEPIQLPIIHSQTPPALWKITQLFEKRNIRRSGQNDRACPRNFQTKSLVDLHLHQSDLSASGEVQALHQSRQRAGRGVRCGHSAWVAGPELSLAASISIRGRQWAAWPGQCRLPSQRRYIC